MTVVEQIIMDVGSFEAEVEKANLAGRISKPAGKFLVEEFIRMAVAYQAQLMMLRDRQEASTGIAIAGPNGPMVRQ